MRLTHYTGIAWDILMTMALRERETGMKRHTSVELGVTSPSNMRHDILKLLALGDIILSTRGVSGGYQLTMPPEEITLARVAEAVELSGPPTAPDSHYAPIEKHLKRSLSRVTLASSLELHDTEEEAQT